MRTAMHDIDNTFVFTKKVVIWSVILVIGAAFLGLQLVSVDDPDIQQYYQLLESSQVSHDSSSALCGCQQREGVQKIVVMSKKNGRHMLRLHGGTSLLKFSFQQDKCDLVEQMDAVTCDQQETLFYRLKDGRNLEMQDNGRLLVLGADRLDPLSWYDKESQDLMPMQTVRHVDAKHAVYYYKKDLLSADAVELARFTDSSHQMREKWENVSPMMQGSAESVKFSIVGDDPSFKAYHLQLKLFNKEGLL